MFMLCLNTMTSMIKTNVFFDFTDVQVRGRGVAVFVSSLEIRGHEHQSEFNVVDRAPCDATNRDFSVLFHHHLLGLCLCGAFDVWSGSV